MAEKLQIASIRSCDWFKSCLFTRLNPGNYWGLHWLLKIWGLLGITEDYRGLLGITGDYWRLLGIIGDYWRLLGITGITGNYWRLL